MLVVGHGVAGTEIEQIEFRVVGEISPHRTAAAHIPARVRVPGLGGFRQFGMLKPILRVSGDGEKPPFQFARIEVIGRDISARVKLGTRIADHDHLARHLWRACAGIGAVRVDERIGSPQLLAGGGIKRYQFSIQCRHIDLALPHGNAAIDRAAASESRRLPIGVRVEIPLLIARGGIERIDLAEGTGGVHDAVHHDGRGLQATVGGGGIVPGDAQAGNRIDIDIVQRRIVLFAVTAACGQPVFRFLGGVEQARGIDSTGRLGALAGIG